jgi:hypothetical protein
MLKIKYLLLIAILIGYIISDYFFNDAILYLVGGFIGASLKGIFGHLNEGIKLMNDLFIVIWMLLLTINIIMLCWVKNKAWRLFFLLSIGVLLYVIDIFVYKVVNIETARSHYLITGICVLIKSTLLFSIVNFTSRFIYEKITP